MGLREKKRKETEEKILRIAKEIFHEKGYSKTSMEEIAEKVEIGVGTLYNYFKSKAEVFIAVMSDTLIGDEEESILLGNDLDISVSSSVADFIWKSFKKTRLISKRAWRDIFSAAFSSMLLDGLLLKGMMKLDNKFIDNLDQLLAGIREKGLLCQGFNTKEASLALYSVIMAQLMIYIYDNELTFQQFEENIRRQVNFIFEGKCSFKQESG